MKDSEDDFEQKLEAVLIRELPQCSKLLEVEQLSGGASQETYRLTISLRGETTGRQHLALRRSPQGVEREVDAEHPGLDVEAELFRIAADAGVPEPTVHYVLGAADGLGEGIVMEWLEGESLGSRIVRSPDLNEVRPGLAYQCGEILARIHSIKLDASLSQRLTVVNPESAVHLSWERYKEFDTPQPMIDFTARWLLNNLPEPVEPRLVHNDFRNGNLMVSKRGIIGVLDWELAHLGDPMRDLGWLCVNSWRFGQIDSPVGGFGQREDLFAGYESVSGQPVDTGRVHFWEVFGSFWWAANSLAMASQHRSGDNTGVERPAISRRSSECQIDCVNLIIPGPVTVMNSRNENDSSDLPRIDELLTSVRDFLRLEVMAETEGRTSFLARVASNSLDIVLRDQVLGPITRTVEKDGLSDLLSQAIRSKGNHGNVTTRAQPRRLNNDADLAHRGPETRSLTELRWELCGGLRSGTIGLDTPGLHQHLRTTVAMQLAIDQPNYSGLALAQSWSG